MNLKIKSAKNEDKNVKIQTVAITWVSPYVIQNSYMEYFKEYVNDRNVFYSKSEYLPLGNFEWISKKYISIISPVSKPQIYGKKPQHSARSREQTVCDQSESWCISVLW